MSFQEEFTSLVYSGFSGLWISTVEPEDTLASIVAEGNRQKWEVFSWDLRDKLVWRTRRSDSSESHVTAMQTAIQDVVANQPSAVLGAWPRLSRQVHELTTAVATDSKAAAKQRNILVLPGWHRKDFSDNTAAQQYLQALVHEGRLTGNAWCIVILAPAADMPRELEQHFTPLRFSLPEVSELRQIIEMVDDVDNPRFEQLPEEEQQHVLGAARGLTRMQAENAFALSLYRKKQFDPGTIWDLKVKSVEQSGMLKVYRGDADMNNIGGMAAIKEFMLKLLGKTRSDPKYYPKGVLLSGMPGTGKSQIVKALGAAVSRPVLMFDIGAAMGSHVGDTEAGIRRALEIADAMQPCLLMLDEVEKSLAGSQGSGANDAGVMKRAVGSLLTYLNDHTTDVMVLCTCNDVTALPPEFTRAERFDAIFFVDLPSETERSQIWRIWSGYYEHMVGDKLLEYLVKMSEHWTGSEIKTACRLAAVLQISLKDSVSQVVPLYTTAQEKLVELQKWASGRCLSASYAGRYRFGKATGEAIPLPTKRTRGVINGTA